MAATTSKLSINNIITKFTQLNNNLPPRTLTITGKLNEITDAGGTSGPAYILQNLVPGVVYKITVRISHRPSGAPSYSIVYQNATPTMVTGLSAGATWPGSITATSSQFYWSVSDPATRLLYYKTSLAEDTTSISFANITRQSTTPYHPNSIKLVNYTSNAKSYSSMTAAGLPAVGLPSLNAVDAYFFLFPFSVGNTMQTLTRALEEGNYLGYNSTTLDLTSDIGYKYIDGVHSIGDASLQYPTGAPINIIANDFSSPNSPFGDITELDRDSKYIAAVILYNVSSDYIPYVNISGSKYIKWYSTELDYAGVWSITFGSFRALQGATGADNYLFASSALAIEIDSIGTVGAVNADTDDFEIVLTATPMNVI